MQEAEKMLRFEEVILPHLDAAHNLARWLVRNDHDAEDIVQEACLRALKYFSAYRGENSRAWSVCTSDLPKSACGNEFLYRRGKGSLAAVKSIIL